MRGREQVARGAMCRLMRTMRRGGDERKIDGEVAGCVLVTYSVPCTNEAPLFINKLNIYYLITLVTRIIKLIL